MGTERCFALVPNHSRASSADAIAGYLRADQPTRAADAARDALANVATRKASAREVATLRQCMSNYPDEFAEYRELNALAVLLAPESVHCAPRPRETPPRACQPTPPRAEPTPSTCEPPPTPECEREAPPAVTATTALIGNFLPAEAAKPGYTEEVYHPLPDPLALAVTNVVPGNRLEVLNLSESPSALWAHDARTLPGNTQKAQEGGTYQLILGEAEKTRLGIEAGDAVAIRQVDPLGLPSAPNLVVFNRTEDSKVPYTMHPSTVPVPLPWAFRQRESTDVLGVEAGDQMLMHVDVRAVGLDVSRIKHEAFSNKITLSFDRAVEPLATVKVFNPRTTEVHNARADAGGSLRLSLDGSPGDALIMTINDHSSVKNWSNLTSRTVVVNGGAQQTPVALDNLSKYFSPPRFAPGRVTTRLSGAEVRLSADRALSPGSVLEITNMRSGTMRCIAADEHGNFEATLAGQRYDVLELRVIDPLTGRRSADAAVRTTVDACSQQLAGDATPVEPAPPLLSRPAVDFAWPIEIERVGTRDARVEFAVKYGISKSAGAGLDWACTVDDEKRTITIDGGYPTIHAPVERGSMEHAASVSLPTRHIRYADDYTLIIKATGRQLCSRTIRRDAERRFTLS